MKDRLEGYRLYGQFFILPSLGVITKFQAHYRPRLAFAWLCWGVSFGLGRSRYG